MADSAEIEIDGDLPRDADGNIVVNVHVENSDTTSPGNVDDGGDNDKPEPDSGGWRSWVIPLAICAVAAIVGVIAVVVGAPIVVAAAAFAVASVAATVALVRAAGAAVAVLSAQSKSDWFVLAILVLAIMLAIAAALEWYKRRKRGRK